MTPAVIEAHQLTGPEYEKIISLLGREPSYTELGIFSVMWSEHCSYKSSRIHLKKLPTRSKLVLQGPGENAGIIDIGDGYAIAFKIESHNHPSFIEPFQGAATGVGGILRDIFTMGARPIAVMDAIRFGPLDIPRNRRILEGVVSGIAHYGNCFGVPTVGGECVFEDCYNGNPLVNAFALGVFRKEDVFYGKAEGVGNPVIYVGAKTGRDGIHGASMASAEFTEESKQKRPNVQMGDPFLEKLLLEACLEAMRTGAIVGIQDMGAAGLTCSTCEMGSRGGVGIEIDLKYVPQRETGMTPYEIMLSESQERMLLVAEKGRENEVFDVFRKWGLDAVEIGRVTEDGILRVLNHGEVAAAIPAHAIAEEGPRYERPIAKPDAAAEAGASAAAVAAALRLPVAAAGADLSGNFLRLLGSPTIASKHWITEQYDSMVQTNTTFGPGAGDAAVLRLKESKRALALATDGNGRWGFLAPRLGAMHAVAEAARNVACSGARPIAATNCLNFGNPEKPEVMWQFSEAIDGIAEACRVLETPITGGNVSFYNETLGKPIYPTPILGVLGLLEDAGNALGSAFRNDGDAILLLDGNSGGVAAPAAIIGEEFASSEYAKTIQGVVAGAPPTIDLAAEKHLIDCLVKLASERVISSAHDVSDGGLAVTLAESCFDTNGLSADVTISGAAPTEPAESALFGERGARAVVTAAAASLARINQIAAQYKVSVQSIGTVVRSEFRIQYSGSPVIQGSVESFQQSWSDSLQKAIEIE